MRNRTGSWIPSTTRSTAMVRKTRMSATESDFHNHPPTSVVALPTRQKPLRTRRSLLRASFHFTNRGFCSPLAQHLCVEICSISPLPPPQKKELHSSFLVYVYPSFQAKCFRLIPTFGRFRVEDLEAGVAGIPLTADGVRSTVRSHRHLQQDPAVLFMCRGGVSHDSWLRLKLTNRTRSIIDVKLMIARQKDPVLFLEGVRGGGLVPPSAVRTISIRCMSLCFTLRPGLNNKPKHL